MQLEQSGRVNENVIFLGKWLPNYTSVKIHDIRNSSVPIREKQHFSTRQVPFANTPV